VGKFSRLLIVLFLALLLAGCTLPFTQAKKAAIQITATPTAAVFLNDERVGNTPFFNDKVKPADYKVKLVTEGSQPTLSWEGRVNLIGGVLTVISRDLGENEEKSSGYVLSLEPQTNKKNASMAVRTVPDGAVVSLNSEPKGFAPLSVDNLNEGEESLVISSPGYTEKSFKAKLIKGYKLVVDVQLAKMPEEKPAEEEKEATESAQASPSPTGSPKASPKASVPASPKASTKASVAPTDDSFPRPYVLIKSPTTGWVRVRKEPNTTSTELTKVNDGEKYKWLETQSGWYKIEYEAGEEGWISGKYAELYK
jgi:hypothetical protein